MFWYKYVRTFLILKVKSFAFGVCFTSNNKLIFYCFSFIRQIKYFCNRNTFRIWINDNTEVV